MQLYILDPAFEIVGMIDESDSILWNKKYNDIGECEIYVECKDEYISMLRRGNYVYRFDDDMLCRIETVNIETDVQNGDYIIATAPDVCTILSGRIVRWTVTFSGKLVDFIARSLNENVIAPEQTQRTIPNFIIDDSNFGELKERVDISAFADDLLQVIIRTCRLHGYGFRVSLDINARKLVFRLYNGKNKATTQSEKYVEFSSRYGNLKASKYKEDESNYKNVVYVGYNDSNGAFKLFSAFKVATEPQGDERRELYVDGTNISREMTERELLQMFPTATRSGAGEPYYIVVDGETITVATTEGTGTDEKILASDYTYYRLINTFGLEALNGRQILQEFNGEVDTIDTYEYKTDYDLGDIVKVASEYGIEAEARIIEIMESDDNEDGYSVEPIFEFIS